jgi:CheY-like chemotaxis protein
MTSPRRGNSFPPCCNASVAKLAEAADGHDALAKASELRPDLIFPDLHMPGRDGFNVCRELRKIAGFASVPIAAMTAGLMNGESEKALASGFSGFLSNPVRILYRGASLPSRKARAKDRSSSGSGIPGTSASAQPKKFLGCLIPHVHQSGTVHADYRIRRNSGDSIRHVSRNVNPHPSYGLPRRSQTQHRTRRASDNAVHIRPQSARRFA